MSAFRLGGGLWIMAGIVCAGLLLFVFVGENLENPAALLENPGLPALVLGGAIVAILIGSSLIARPGSALVRWSTIAGVAWLILFGSVAVTALGGSEIGPVVSSGLITALGATAALVTHRSAVESGSAD
jgi:hypothetical protein